MRMHTERTGEGRALALALVALLATTAPAAAQTAVSFEELPSVLRRGDLVTVTDDQGRRLGGRILDLSPSGLSLEYTGARLDLSADQVARIRHQRFDSLGNGTLIGVGIGAIPGFLLGMAVSESGGFGQALALGLGVGGGIGAAVDALIPESRVVYDPTGAARQRWTVTPLLSAHRRGVAVSLGF